MRKEVLFNITDDGRQLTFKVKQMPATKGERWVNRVVALLANSATGQISDFEFSSLKAKFSGPDKLQEIFKVIGQLDYDKVEPLYDELLNCCEHVPDPANTSFSVPCTAANIDTIIGEFKNLYRLRWEALKVNFDFFQIGQNAQGQQVQPSITFAKTTAMSGR